MELLEHARLTALIREIAISSAQVVIDYEQELSEGEKVVLAAVAKSCETLLSPDASADELRETGRYFFQLAMGNHHLVAIMDRLGGTSNLCKSPDSADREPVDGGAA